MEGSPSWWSRWSNVSYASGRKEGEEGVTGEAPPQLGLRSLSLHAGWSRHQYIIPQNSSGLRKPHLDASQYKLFSGVFCLMGRMRALFFSRAPVPAMSAWEQNFKISGLCVQISEMQQFITAFSPPLMENGLAEAGGEWRSVCWKGDFLIFYPAINILLKGPDVLSAYTRERLYSSLMVGDWGSALSTLFWVFPCLSWRLIILCQ